MNSQTFDELLNQLAANGIPVETAALIAAGVVLLLAILYFVPRFARPKAAPRVSPRPGKAGAAPAKIAETPNFPLPEPKATAIPAVAQSVALAGTSEPPSPEPEAAATPRFAEPVAMAEAPVQTIPVQTPAAPPARPAPWIPEDSVLRRHFLGHLAMMLETLAAPAPTDSVLRRHHGQWLRARFTAALSDPAALEQIKADYAALRARPATEPPAPATVVATACVAAPAPVVAVAATPPAPAPAAAARPEMAWIPEDSVLRRHFLSQVAMMLESLAPPAPSDSVLRRHHEQWLRARFTATLSDPARLEQLKRDYAALRALRATAAPIPASAAAPLAAAVPRQAVRIPEDSVLRRHFLGHLAMMLERLAPPAPTDSVLRRHHQHWLLSEFKACLRDPSHLQRLVADYQGQRTAKA